MSVPIKNLSIGNGNTAFVARTNNRNNNWTGSNNSADRCSELVGYPPNFKKNIGANRVSTSNNVVTRNRDQSNTFTDDQYRRLMSLISEKFGSSSILANIAGGGTGTEFVNRNMIKFCNEHGIIHQTFCAYTPQQNGIAERKHRHLLNVARTPSYVLSGKSRYEMIFKHEPNLSHLKVFGCLCFSTVLNNNDKFSSSSENKDYELEINNLNGLNFFNCDLKEDLSSEPNDDRRNSKSENSKGTDQLSQGDNQGVNLRRSTRKTSMPVKLSDFEVNTKVKYNIDRQAAKDIRWLEAMNQEMEALNRNGTWEITKLPIGRKPIGHKWVYKVKYQSSGEVDRFKARLVAKGFNQKERIDYEKTFSPVVKIVTVRTPSSVLSRKSPYEMIFKNEPNLSHLKVFGCLCFSTVLNNNDKFSSRDVKFYETVFPFKNTSENKDYELEINNLNGLNFFNCDLEEDLSSEPNDDRRDSKSKNSKGTDQLSQGGIEKSDTANKDEVGHLDDGKSEEEACDNESAILEDNNSESEGDDTAYQEFNNQFQSPVHVENPDNQGVNLKRSTRKTSMPAKLSDFEPRTYSEAAKDIRWLEAMNQEMEALNRNSTWEITKLPIGRKPIGHKWVYKLVEEIYMTLPEGYFDKEDKRVCKLVKSLYGLKQAPRKWNEKLVSVLLENGFTQSKNDFSLFTKNKNGIFVALLVCVDDIVITRNNNDEIKKVKDFLSSKFLIKDLGKLKYFLGIEVLESKGNLYLTQRKYCLEVLAEFRMLTCRPCGTPIESKDSTTKSGKVVIDNPLNIINNYQKLVGKLIYLTHTRPDISYVVHVLSQFMHAPLQSHLKLAFRVLRYLTNAPGKGISFVKSNDLNLSIFVDSDWSKCKVTKRSVTGYSVFLGKNLVSWKSKKQSMLAKSSAEAEYIAKNTVTCEVIWIHKILTELNVQISLHVPIHCDNSFAIQIAANPVLHEKTKHFEIEFYEAYAITGAEKNNAIQANMDVNNTDYFNRLLQLQMVYRITNFICENTKPYLQTLENKISLKFGKITSFHALPEKQSEFPEHHFEFVAYNQLSSRVPYRDENSKTIYPMLTDYLKCIRSISDIMPFGDANKGQGWLRKVDIENLEREVMAKFLEWSSGQATWSGGQDVGVVPKGLEWWPRVLLGAQGRLLDINVDRIGIDDLAKQFNKEEIENISRPIIIAVSSCKVSKYRDLQLSATYATYYYINPQTPEAKYAYTEQTLHALIQQNPETFPGVRFTCEATITSVAENRSWNYSSCSECNKKSTKVDGIYKCEDHGIQEPLTYKYNFKATVSDATAVAYFTFFTKAGEKITGSPCSELVAKYKIMDQRSGQFTVVDILDIQPALEIEQTGITLDVTTTKVAEESTCKGKEKSSTCYTIITNEKLNIYYT
ncbi:ribonuclease H-like domain-containing protein [Tanacetum coccineum]